MALRADPIDVNWIFAMHRGIRCILEFGQTLEPSLLVLHNAQKITEEDDDCDLSNCRYVNRSALFDLRGEVLDEC
jgi:hypothetical protein